MRKKINVQYIVKKDFQNNVKWRRCTYPKWEVVLGAPEPCA